MENKLYNHVEVFKAWQNGATIQLYDEFQWKCLTTNPGWHPFNRYRATTCDGIIAESVPYDNKDETCGEIPPDGLKKRIANLESTIDEQAERIAELVQDRKDDRGIISAMAARMAAKDAEIKFYQEIISEKFKQESKGNE